MRRTWVLILGSGLLIAGLGFTFHLLAGPEDTATAVRRAARPLPAGDPFDPGPGLWVSEPVKPTLGPAARDLPPYEPEFYLDREINPRFGLNAGDDREGGGILGGVDPLLALQAGAPAAAVNSFLTPTLNFDGQGYTFVNPPDTVGDVGPDNYVQIVNSSGGGLFTIHDKVTGAVTTGPVAIDALGSGGNCATGSGDGIVLYDPLADRWLLSEFADIGNHLCVYISQGPDPSGAYFRYDFPTPNFPDYPKYAMWPDAYYVSTNENSPAVYALDRNRMLTGAAATMQRFTGPDLAAFPFQAFTPSDLDGPAPPPPGSPNFFIRHRDDEAHNPGANDPTRDFLEIWEFSVDFATPANSSFTGPLNIPIAEFDSHLCGYSSFACFPQPGTSTTLDPLREVVMWRLQYRNFGSHETLVGNLVTDVDGTDHGGVRWFELRRGAAWTLHQEGTYAPDAHSRWMGSAAMDGEGNIAVAYNVTSKTLFPSLRYAGRLVADPPGTLPHGEVTLITGAAANASNRYGDYSSLNVDPVDDCTFWFTGEYNAGSQWSTRIGRFRFDGCGTPDFTINALPTGQAVCSGSDALYDVDLDSVGGFADVVTLSTSGAPGTAVFNPPSLTPPGSSQLTISNAPLGSYGFDIVAMGGTSVHSESVSLDVVQLPTGAMPLQPPDGSTGVATSPLFRWTAVPGAAQYLVEIATDPQFNTVVASGSTIGTGFMPLPLAQDTVYFWRVTPSNVCGPGPLSPVWAFRTGVTSCSVHASTDVPRPIPVTGTPTVTSTLNVTGSAVIDDLNVLNLSGTHSWIGDLDFNLTSPLGSELRLMDQACGNADDFNLNLDDEAPPGERPCPPVGGGTYRPDNPLRLFDAQDANGLWILTINDNADFDGGSLNSWSLEICTTGPASPADYSDLPVTYGVAWHEGNGTLRLGNNWDADAGFAAGQDDGDDDGVGFANALIAGQPFTVSLDVQGGAGAASVWFDWNKDGDFDDPGELALDKPVTAGINVLAGHVPAGAQVVGDIPYRARLYDPTTAAPGSIPVTGGQPFGEVTDGMAPGGVPTAVRLTTSTAASDRLIAWLLPLLLALLTLARLVSRRHSRIPNNL